MSRNGGQVVSALGLFSEDPSLNPPEYLKNYYEKNEHISREAGVSPLPIYCNKKPQTINYSLKKLNVNSELDLQSVTIYLQYDFIEFSKLILQKAVDLILQIYF